MKDVIRWWRSFCHILLSTVQRFEATERRRDAGALTYTTLFALVPVITVSYSILSAIPALQTWGEQANQQLLAYVMPEGSDVISGYLQQFSSQARKLTWVGAIFLFVTALMLLRTIELQFNRIWQVERSRTGMNTFFRYWAVLTLGPLLFGAAFAASSFLASLPLWTEETGLWLEVAAILPWLFSSAAIACLYVLVPNCQVPLPAATAAAVLVATIFEVGKYLFANIIGMFPSYQLIYGAFAAVPLFLLWVYLSWSLILLGAELSYALARDNQSGRKSRKSRTSYSSRLETRVAVLQQLASAQNEQQLLSEDDLRYAQAELKHLQQATLVSRHSEQGWVLLPDLQHVSMQQLCQDLPLQELQQPVAVLQHWQQQWLQQGDAALQQSLATALAATAEQPNTQH
ncbi:ribonuclease [Bacterioplanes sanyensis]|uniref:UPF0761 membrane protein CHH28_17590 n=1 Tax=Bacterioplanes sanyensis TaxID=1249553 RepID=A0A222FMX5_9GAMM|nr:YihY family inner membrane protein [Bacterioplanes sanyensis]ASP40378.1 ribonuclease [Bacterioplanes sanyensis]